MMILIISESHSLLPDQRRAIEARWGAEGAGWTIHRAPAAGWTAAEMSALADAWGAQHRHPQICFASPIAGMMCLCARRHIKIFAMHNDRRDASEQRQPDGSIRLIHKIAAEGWQILPS